MRNGIYKKNMEKFSKFMTDVKDEIHIEKPKKRPTCPECDEFIEHCDCEDEKKKSNK